jgi:hypothetical protein
MLCFWDAFIWQRFESAGGDKENIPRLPESHAIVAVTSAFHFDTPNGMILQAFNGKHKSVPSAIVRVNNSLQIC